MSAARGSVIDWAAFAIDFYLNVTLIRSDIKRQGRPAASTGLRSVASTWSHKVAPSHLAHYRRARRYLRSDTLTGQPDRDGPPDKENCEPFVKVAKLMHAAGLKAPDVLAWDAPQGFMLLTDLGDKTMMSAIDAQNPQANHALYMQAVDALIAWQLSLSRVFCHSTMRPCFSAN
jgi:aminoglycoside/choline kinase family phosphotransferase